MANKNYFTSQDASYSRTNIFTKINIMIDFMRLPYTENTLWQLRRIVLQNLWNNKRNNFNSKI